MQHKTVIERNRLLLLIIPSFIIGIISYFTIWFGDDIYYAYNFARLPEFHPISNASEFIQSQIQHYLTVNGRFFPHILIQLFDGILGHACFATANAIVYFYFFKILIKISSIQQHNLLGIIGIVCVTLLTLQTKMTPTCQICYIWVFLFNLIVIERFLLTTVQASVWKYILWTVFSVLVGNGNEAISLGVAGAFGIYAINHKFKITPLQWCILIGYSIGVLADCLSPSTLNRGIANEAANSESGIGITAILQILFLPRSTYLLLFTVCVLRVSKSIKLVQFYKDNSIYWNIFIICLLLNLIILPRYNRPLFGMELMAVILTFKALPKHAFNKWLTTLLVVLTLLMLYAQWNINLNKFQFIESVKTEYNKSKDGRVYADLNFEAPLPSHTDYASTLDPYAPMSASEYQFMTSHIKVLVPNKPDLRILPSILKNDLPKSSGVHHLSGSHWLIIEYKNQPIEVGIKRNINLGILNKEYPAEPIDFKDRIFYTTDEYSCATVNTQEYSIMGLSTNTPVIIHN